MFWSQADRQKCQDVDGWFNYSQICIISIVTTDHTPVQYYLSKPEVPKNRIISLCIHYLFRNDLLHAYFSWNLTGKKGGEKAVFFSLILLMNQDYSITCILFYMLCMNTWQKVYTEVKLLNLTKLGLIENSSPHQLSSPPPPLQPLSPPSSPNFNDDTSECKSSQLH